MRVLKLTGQAVALAAVAGLLGLLVWRLTHQSHPPKIGAPAPSFSLRRIGAPGRLDLASLRGKPVVLNFWASWCVPCKGEAKMLEQAWRRHRKHGASAATRVGTGRAPAIRRPLQRCRVRRTEAARPQSDA